MLPSGIPQGVGISLYMAGEAGCLLAVTTWQGDRVNTGTLAPLPSCLVARWRQLAWPAIHVSFSHPAHTNTHLLPGVNEGYDYLFISVQPYSIMCFQYISVQARLIMLIMGFTVVSFVSLDKCNKPLFCPACRTTGRNKISSGLSHKCSLY